MRSPNEKYNNVDFSRFFGIEDLGDEDFRIDDDEFISSRGKSKAQYRWSNVQKIRDDRDRSAEKFTVEDFDGYSQSELVKFLRREVFIYQYNRTAAPRAFGAKVMNPISNQHENFLSKKANKSIPVDALVRLLSKENSESIGDIYDAFIIYARNINDLPYSKLVEIIKGKNVRQLNVNATEVSTVLQQGNENIFTKLDKYLTTLDEKNLTDTTKGFLTKKYIEYIYLQLKDITSYVESHRGKNKLDIAGRSAFEESLPVLVNDFLEKYKEDYDKDNKLKISQISDIEFNQINNEKKKLNFADKNPAIEPVISEILTESQFADITSEKTTKDKIDKILFNVFQLSEEETRKGELYPYLINNYVNKSTYELKHYFETEESLKDVYNKYKSRIDSILGVIVLTSQQSKVFSVFEEMMNEIAHLNFKTLNKDENNLVIAPGFWKRAKGSLSFDTSEGKSFFIENIIIKGFYEAIKELQSGPKKDVLEYNLIPTTDSAARSDGPFQYLARRNLLILGKKFVEDMNNIGRELDEDETKLVEYIRDNAYKKVYQVPSEIDKTLLYLSALKEFRNEDFSEIIKLQIESFTLYKNYHEDLKPAISSIMPMFIQDGKRIMTEDGRKMVTQYFIANNNFEIINVNLANVSKLEELYVESEHLYGKMVIIDEAFFIENIDEKVQNLVDLGAKVVQVGASRNEIREQNKKSSKNNKIKEVRYLREIDAEIDGLRSDDIINKEKKDERLKELAHLREECIHISGSKGSKSDKEPRKLKNREIENLHKKSELYTNNVGNLRKRREKAESIATKIFDNSPTVGNLLEDIRDGNWHQWIANNTQGSIAKSQNLLFDYSFNFGGCRDINDRNEIDSLLKKAAYKDIHIRHIVKTVDQKGQDSIRYFDPLDEKIKQGKTLPIEKDVADNVIIYGLRANFEEQSLDEAIELLYSYVVIGGQLKVYCVSTKDDPSIKDFKNLNDFNILKTGHSADKLKELIVENIEQRRYIDAYKNALDKKKKYLRHDIIDSANIHSTSYINVETGEVENIKSEESECEWIKNDVYNLLQIRARQPDTLIVANYSADSGEHKFVALQPRKGTVEVFKDARSFKSFVDHYQSFHGKICMIYDENFVIGGDFLSFSSLSDNRTGENAVNDKQNFYITNKKSLNLDWFKQAASRDRSNVKELERKLFYDECLSSILVEEVTKLGNFLSEDEKVNKNLKTADEVASYRHVKLLHKNAVVKDLREEIESLAIKIGKRLDVDDSEIDGILEDKIEVGEDETTVIRDEISKGKGTLYRNSKGIEFIENRLRLKEGSENLLAGFKRVSYEELDEYEDMVTKSKLHFDGSLDINYDDQFPCAIGDHTGQDIDDIAKIYRDLQSYIFYQSILAHIPGGGVDESKKFILRNYEQIIFHLKDYSLEEKDIDTILEKNENGGLREKNQSPSRFLDPDYIEKLSKIVFSQKTIFAKRRDILEKGYEVLEDKYELEIQIKRQRRETEELDSHFAQLDDDETTTDFLSNFREESDAMAEIATNKTKISINMSSNIDEAFLREMDENNSLAENALKYSKDVSELKSKNKSLLEKIDELNSKIDGMQKKQEENEVLKQRFAEFDEKDQEIRRLKDMLEMAEITQDNNNSKLEEALITIEILDFHLGKTIETANEQDAVGDKVRDLKVYSSSEEVMNNILIRSKDENGKSNQHPIFAFLESPKELFDFIKTSEFDIEKFKTTSDYQNDVLFQETVNYIDQFRDSPKELYGYKGKEVKTQKSIFTNGNLSPISSTNRYLSICPSDITFTKEKDQTIDDDRYYHMQFSRVYFYEDSDYEDKLFKYPNFKNVSLKACTFENIDDFSRISDPTFLNTIKINNSEFKNVNFSRLNVEQFKKIMSISDRDFNKTKNTFDSCTPPSGVENINEIFTDSVVRNTIFSTPGKKPKPDSRENRTEVIREESQSNGNSNSVNSSASAVTLTENTTETRGSVPATKTAVPSSAKSAIQVVANVNGHHSKA